MKTILAVSILKTQTKIIVFRINNNKFIIKDVSILNKHIYEDVVLNKIQSIVKSYTINFIYISIYKSFDKSKINLFFNNLEISNIYYQSFLLDYNFNNKISQNLSNGWIDFYKIQNIDIKILIEYTIKSLK